MIELHRDGMRRRPKAALSLCCIAVLLHAAIGSSSASASPSAVAPPSPTTAVVANVDVQHALQVRQLLQRRLDYVATGRRRRDFARWVQRQDGRPRIFSMHGVEPDPDWNRLRHAAADVAGDMQHQHQQQLQQRKQQKLERAPKDRSSATDAPPIQRSEQERRRDRLDPFPEDRMNLELCITTGNAPCPHVQALAEASPPSAVQLLVRAVVLALRFGPVLSTLSLALLWPRFRSQVWYPWLTHCMAACGPAWIKWGQWSSTRNDMFPEPLCEALSRLQSHAPAHPWSVTRGTVEASLGLAPGALPLVFDAFDTVPIASGSIAQVHRAVLGGEPVAVKVRHPRVQRLMEMDFRLMGLLARAADWVVVRLTGAGSDIRGSVTQFSHTMAAQSYLQVEAHHLEVLNDNFKTWPQVRFPLPFFASDAVIIETFEPGQIVSSMIEEYHHQAMEISQTAVADKSRTDPIPSRAAESGVIAVSPNNEKAVAVVDRSDPSEFRKLEGHDLIPLDVAKFLVTTGLGLYLKMLLVDGLMHADLHPGNIMIDLDRTRQRQNMCDPDDTDTNSDLNSVVTTQPRKPGTFLGITLVDAGMVAELTERESATFIGLLASIGEGNGRDAANFALQFSLDNNMGAKEREAFCQAMDELFRERCKGYHSNIDVGLVLRGVLGLIRKHRVRIDANYATLVVNALCVESLARSVCPGYNVLDAAKPLLRTYRKLCYDRRGKPIPNAPKSKRVRAWMGLMYWRKNHLDKLFFKNEAQRRRREVRRRQQ